MVGIGPNGNGQFHPEAIRQLEAAGEWLKINGEGIYGTRLWQPHWEEGPKIRFTSKKENNIVYVFTFEWPTKLFQIKCVQPAADSEIYLLGYSTPLTWQYNPDNGLEIQIPPEISDQKPCDFAWGFKIQII